MHARLNTTFGNAGTPGGWRAVGATPSLPVPRRVPARGGSVRRRGFTLTEILIVIGLIVLVISLAVPAFNAMTGGRSIDAASNQLSAMLGRARMEAIGLQEPRGLLFYRDPATQRVAARLVRTGDATVIGMNMVSLDLVPNADPMFLPVGVGLQVVGDVRKAGDDRYIGFNTKFGGGPPLNVAVGGLILFDQSGRLTNRAYGLVAWVELTKGGAKQTTEMGRFIHGTNASASGTQVLSPNTTTNPEVIRSQFGFVLYDEEAYLNQPFASNGPEKTYEDRELGGGSANEALEEGWLDANATPVLINRYNGTLVRGE